MAESDQESDFASAESDQEEKVTSSGPPIQGGGGEDRDPGSRGTGSRGMDSEGRESPQHAGREGSPQQPGGEEEGVKVADEEEGRVESGAGVGEQGGPEAGERREGGPKEEEEAGRKEEGDSLGGPKEEKGGDSLEGPPEHVVESKQDAPASGEGGGGWGGWGGWSSLWSSVSTVTGSAQALGQKVSSVIASVEDTLGLPSPQELVTREEEEEAKEATEVKELADKLVEHDAPEEQTTPIQEEPHSAPKPSEPRSVPGAQGEGPDSEQQSRVDRASTSPSSYAAFAGFFSGLAAAVQTTGKGLVSGGIDVLETLGKKTVEVLTEGDPGLHKKRAMVSGGQAPTLSQLLEEAKAHSEAAAAAKQAEGASYSAPETLNYSVLFDEYQGVVHLEALELLSNECESKVRSSLSAFTGDDLEAIRAGMERVSQAFRLEETDVLDDESSQLGEVLQLFSDITLPLKVEKLIKVSESWRSKMEAIMEERKEEEGGKETQRGESEEAADEGEKVVGDTGGEEAQPTGGGADRGEMVAGSGTAARDEGSRLKALQENGLRSLAEVTSASIELFRKMAEVSLLPNAVKSDALKQAEKLNRLTVLVSTELDSLASLHAEAITGLDIQESISVVTSLCLEASNSCSYVQDAFQLLCPVLQYLSVQQTLVSVPSAHIHSRS